MIELSEDNYTLLWYNDEKELILQCGDFDEDQFIELLSEYYGDKLLSYEDIRGELCFKFSEDIDLDELQNIIEYLSLTAHELKKISRIINTLLKENKNADGKTTPDVVDAGTVEQHDIPEDGDNDRSTEVRHKPSPGGKPAPRNKPF